MKLLCAMYGYCLMEITALIAIVNANYDLRGDFINKRKDI